MDLTHILTALATLLGAFLAQHIHDRAKDVEQDKRLDAQDKRCKENHPQGSQGLLR